MTSAAARSDGVPRKHSGRLVQALCLGAIAIGITVITGYALGNASIAALGTNGKPGAAVSGLVFIVLGAGLIALQRRPTTGFLTPRHATLAAMFIAATILLAAPLSWDLEEWQVWGTRGGVYFHPFPITALLLLALASTLVLVPTRWNFAAHVIASAVLLIGIVFLFGYVLRVPSFLDPTGRTAPVVVTACGMVLLSAAAVLVRPRGWIVPLLSRTSAGAMSRLLLPAILIVPFFSIALNHRLTRDLGHTPQVGLTAVVAVNVFFSAAILFGAGAALHKRESDRLRLAAIVNSSAEAITGISKSGIIESWNGGAERIYGYTQAEAIGRSIRMLAPPEGEDEISLLIERARRGERVESIETVRLAKDGRRVDVLLNVSPVLDDEGNLSGAAAIAHDITYRKHTQEALKKSEAALKEAQRVAKIGHWETSLLTGTVTWSDETYRILGIPIGSVTPRHDLFLAMMDPEDRRREREAVARVLASTDDADFETDLEVRVTTPAGASLVLAQRVFVDRDAAGNVVGFHGTIQDITERVASEQALRDSEAALSEAQEIAHIGSWILYPESGEATVSPETFRIFGIEPRSRVRVPKFLDLVHEEDRAAVAARVTESLATRRFDVEFRVETPLGLRLVRAVARKREAGEPRLSMIGTVQDVTDRRAADEALRTSEAALREAQRMAAVGHWEWSPVTGAVTWSDETYRILGISREVEASFDLFASAIEARDRRMFEEMVAGTLQPGGENDLSVDLGISTPAGQTLAVSARIVLDRDAHGDVVMLHGTIQDITQRVATEQALRDSEEALAEAQQIAHVGSWITDPESGQVRASAETFRIYGLDPAPVVPLELFVEKVHEEDRPRAEAAIATSLGTGIQDIVFRIVTPHGTRVVHSIARQREPGDPHSSLIGTTQDITEQTAVQDALRHRTESLEHSNAELERFNRAAVGRELRMIELKQQINDLCAQLGQPSPYVLPEQVALAREAT